MRRRILLAAVSTLLAIGAMEFAARFMIRPLDGCYGTFSGWRLPPKAVIPYEEPAAGTDRDEWYKELVVDGARITSGDLWGFLREDPVLGYAPQENRRSLNGWWQSNSIGAREREETPGPRLPGTRRLLLFGDSFAQGSRVPQAEAWDFLLDAMRDDSDVVNMAVDGYGMAQCLLRYREIKQRLDHDIVLLALVPIRDLWRDINTVRSLGEDWDLYWLMPRFTLDHGHLTLVPSLYRKADQVFLANRYGLSPELEQHLTRYDRFYVEGEYTVPPIIGRSALYKIGATAYWRVKRRAKRNSRLDPASEELRVAHAIFQEFARETSAEGARLMLVFLPSHLDLVKLRGRTYRRNWQAMVAEACVGPVTCIDLAADLEKVPPEERDYGYDGTHFGPLINRRIAELIDAKLTFRGAD